MTDAITQTLSRYLAGAALVLSVAALILGGPLMALGAVIGGAVAFVNWMALKWIVRTVIVGARPLRAVAVFMLTGKLVVLSAICWALIARWGVHPVGFGVGLSSLVVAVLLVAFTIGHDAAWAEESA